MPHRDEIKKWRETIRARYEGYLKTSFHFRDADLRASFAQALAQYDIMKGEEFREPARNFARGASALELALERFGDDGAKIEPALRKDNLYRHQERAMRLVHEGENVVVSTGTASGKTESFLYPILFELFEQFRANKLDSEKGVRALILYPMNALANDQRRRLGEICKALSESGNGFKPTFGQYTGETPEDKFDKRRNAEKRDEERFDGELVFRKEMRENPPHILLTNYSMLEYLLIRPEDSQLFDGDRGRHWQFLVLDEAHQYRGAKGMEMAMLMRRLKQRLRDGGRGDRPFRCIATSATISSGESEEDQHAVAEFASELFGENFSVKSVVFADAGEAMQESEEKAQRFHFFLRALEGAFLIHRGGKDEVVLNRETGEDDASVKPAVPLEIALCKECGQHYYVGRKNGGSVAEEAIRDPSAEGFGVDFYLPLDGAETPENPDAETKSLCRRCGDLSDGNLDCGCGASIRVEKCIAHEEHPDRIKECAVCNWKFGDPVQEIVHGSDAPNAVIATALHCLLPPERRRILAFADSRQQAAFFAWYAEDSYGKIRDRNLIMRALRSSDGEQLSLEDLAARLRTVFEKCGMFSEKDTSETRKRKVFETIYREMVSGRKQVSLEGVGLVKWSVLVPGDLRAPPEMLDAPWLFKKSEAIDLVSFLLGDLRAGCVEDPNDVDLDWSKLAPYPIRESISLEKWENKQRGVVRHFLVRLLSDGSQAEKLQAAQNLRCAVWREIRRRDEDHGEGEKILKRAQGNEFRLNPAWLRIEPRPSDLFECDTCGGLHLFNFRGVCPRNRCPGRLCPSGAEKFSRNHYRALYEDNEMPVEMRAEEHTAQLQSQEASDRQDDFKAGKIHLLSSSTTFEVGVDLGELEVVFLRNVPPEPFNYTQRAGRAGRADTPGLVLTYCRRNPHDLYHYFDPENRIIKGEIRPPRLRVSNKKIILRHIVATALSAFFREHPERFKNVEQLVGGDWNEPRGVADFRRFCMENRDSLEKTLRAIVPMEVRDEVGLGAESGWIENVAGEFDLSGTGENRRFALAESVVCADHCNMKKLRHRYRDKNEDRKAVQIGDRMNTIARETTLEFLSRNAVIPKYGFPVDVVELDTRPRDSRRAAQGEARKIVLQRDLAQAVAEFAPGSKVVANKKEWKSCGIKIVPESALEVVHYQRDANRNFRQWKVGDPNLPNGTKMYLRPQFGFVTPLLESPKTPQRRSRQLYTTRPYFRGFDKDLSTPPTRIFDVEITQALPGGMVVLCEGKHGGGFYICRRCGAGFSETKVDRQRRHDTPDGGKCDGTLENVSLGHEFVTDVTRLEFPRVGEEWSAYSLAYAILLGASDMLDVPDTDLNTTITGGEKGNLAIVLYDNVPGGAGLVASLVADLEKDESVFRQVLRRAKNRVKGECGCGESCYGCLRSYRNQFAHPHLQRKAALDILEKTLAEN